MDQPSPSLQGAVDFVNQTFSNYEQNRRTIQDKWDRNHRAFVREEGDDVWKTGEGEDWRSKTYIGKTREKVMAAASLIIDTILQGGKAPYALKASPWQPAEQQQEQPGMEEADPSGDIDAMTALIDQQLVDTHADRQLMKHVMCQALYGLTWAKKIVHNVKRNGWRKETLTIDGIDDFSRVPSATTWSRWKTEFSSPGWVYVPVWDVFWDVESDNLQDSAGIIHRQVVSPYWLRSKIGRPYFITENLNAAAKQAAGGTNVPTPNVNDTADNTTLAPMLRNVKFRKNTLTYKEYWGRIPRDLAQRIEEQLSGQGWTGDATELAQNQEDGDEVEVLLCVCGQYVVRYCRNEPGNRPFVMAKCEDNIEEETPWGIADNCEPMQKVINGAMRAFEDNKKLSANVILALKRRYLKNVPNTIKPGMKLDLSDECDDARKAIQQVVIQDVGQTLVSLLELAFPMLDDASMVPRLAQGYTDPNVQTATEISVRQAQSSKYIGMVIRNLDEGIIEPMVEYLYEFNMDDPEVAVGKGNYVVQALGFSAYQNRVERMRKLQELLALALSNPTLTQRTKIDYLYRELVKATDLDPDMIVIPDAQLQPPEPDQLQEAETGKTQAQAQESEARAVLALAQAEAINNGDGPGQGEGEDKDDVRNVD